MPPSLASCRPRTDPPRYSPRLSGPRLSRIRRIRQPRYCHHGAVRRLRQVDIALNRDRDGVLILLASGLLWPILRASNSGTTTRRGSAPLATPSSAEPGATIATCAMSSTRTDAAAGCLDRLPQALTVGGVVRVRSSLFENKRYCVQGALFGLCPRKPCCCQHQFPEVDFVQTSLVSCPNKPRCGPVC